MALTQQQIAEFYALRAQYLEKVLPNLLKEVSSSKYASWASKEWKTVNKLAKQAYKCCKPILDHNINMASEQDWNAIKESLEELNQAVQKYLNKINGDSPDAISSRREKKRALAEDVQDLIKIVNAEPEQVNAEPKQVNAKPEQVNAKPKQVNAKPEPTIDNQYQALLRYNQAKQNKELMVASRLEERIYKKPPTKAEDWKDKVVLGSITRNTWVSGLSVLFSFREYKWLVNSISSFNKAYTNYIRNPLSESRKSEFDSCRNQMEQNAQFVIEQLLGKNWGEDSKKDLEKEQELSDMQKEKLYMARTALAMATVLKSNDNNNNNNNNDVLKNDKCYQHAVANFWNTQQRLAEMEDIMRGTYRDSKSFQKFYQAARDYQNVMLRKITDPKSVEEKDYVKAVSQLKDAAIGYTPDKLAKQGRLPFEFSLTEKKYLEDVTNTIQLSEPSQQKVKLALGVLNDAVLNDAKPNIYTTTFTNNNKNNNTIVYQKN